MTEFIPFVEKYRPVQSIDIVLDPFNRKILSTSISSGKMLNLMLYGPPGTGKTTSIFSYVKDFDNINGTNTSILNLNASDDRGIAVIRERITQFVHSMTMFNVGFKLVILDEVDYMTPDAQRALKCLLQQYPTNVRFCLICNYIGRIDKSLQNDFIRLRFNQLPPHEITPFLKKIVDNEKLSISTESISLIQNIYKSDIRSMINFLQSHQDIVDDDLHIINNGVYDELLSLIKCKTNTTDFLKAFIVKMSVKYHIDPKNIVCNFFNFIIRFHPELITSQFLNFVENLTHAENCKTANIISYFLVSMKLHLG